MVDSKWAHETIRPILLGFHARPAVISEVCKLYHRLDDIHWLGGFVCVERVHHCRPHSIVNLHIPPNLRPAKLAAYIADMGCHRPQYPGDFNGSVAAPKAGRSSTDNPRPWLLWGHATFGCSRSSQRCEGCLCKLQQWWRLADSGVVGHGGHIDVCLPFHR